MKLISTHNNTRLNFNEIGIIDIYAHKHWVNLKYFSAIKNQPKTFAFWFVTKKKYFDPTTHVKVFRKTKQNRFVCKITHLTWMMKLQGLFTNFEYMAFFSWPPKETKEAKLICMQKKNTKFNFNFEIKHNFNTMSLWIHR